MISLYHLYLYQLILFTGSPAYELCQDDKKFEELELAIYKYFANHSSPDFLRRIATVPNTDNPFSFNEHSNTSYMESEIHVFRRTVAYVPHKLYVSYHNMGYLDHNHTIGLSESPISNLF